MNILKIQDNLKNLSDEQLAQEMRLPSGTAPQYLVMTEMQRRQKMRDEFSGNQPPKTTMAEEMSGEAPPQPPAPPEGGQPPDGGQAETAPQEANAQGLMGLPDQTMAGNAMRAKITGQPQQVDNMTAMPPQGMAAGGAVQFGNPFAGATMGTPATPSTGYSPIQQYNPAPYTYTAPENDYSNLQYSLKNQYSRTPPPHTANPRGHLTENQRYGIPESMKAPGPGTPGLLTSTHRDGSETYYWAAPRYRDAYIKSMTPAATATTTAPAAVPATTTVVTKAGGGPIRMGGGMGVPAVGDLPVLGGPETSSFEDWRLSGAAPNMDAIQMMPWPERKKAIEKILKKDRIVPFATPGNPNYEQEYRGILAQELEKAGVEERMSKRDFGPLFGSLFTPKGTVEAHDRETAALEAERARLGHYTLPSPNKRAMTARELADLAARHNGPTPTAQAAELAEPDQSTPSANAPGAPSGELPAFKDDYASLGMMPQQKGTPPSAAISGLPSIPAMPNIRPSGGGIASLPKAQKDTSYEDYMKQANALLSEAAGDPKADKDRSINNALMKLGLGMAASKNQSVLGAVAEGGLPALEQYTADEAQRRKDARALAGEKLTVLGAGTQMRQAAEKDYRDQMTKAEELRLRGMETEAKMLADQANAAYQMAGLQIRGWEAQNTAQHQADVLEETRRSNKAAEDKLPETVRALQAQYGDKWRIAGEAAMLQESIKLKDDRLKTLAANNLLEASNPLIADLAADEARLKKIREDLYGTGTTGTTGTQVRRADANGNIIQ